MNDLNFARKFIKEILEKEKWFAEIKGRNSIDAILLTGSTITKDNDKYSDFDLFLVCNRNNQKKYSLKPIYKYSFCGNKIEISLVSSEKIINDSYNKKNLFWWYNCRIVQSYSKDFLHSFKKASTITKKELRDRLWTNWVSFKINTDSILSLKKRKELLGMIILFSKNVKIFIDSFLTINNIFIHYKWQAQNIKKIDKVLYYNLLKMNNLLKTKDIIENNCILEKKLYLILIKYGFRKYILDNWPNCNLTWLTFQYM